MRRDQFTHAEEAEMEARQAWEDSLPEGADDSAAAWARVKAEAEQDAAERIAEMRSW